MPIQGHVEDFSQARVDKAIMDSAHLAERAQPPPGGKAAGRKGLKRIGQGHVYLRGSDSRRQMISVDADAVLLDEFDEMKDGVLELAKKRLASSGLGWLRIASTPRYPETGVNGLFLGSDRRYYFLPCPHCGLKPKVGDKEKGGIEMLLIVEIVLTVFAWRRGWKGWALLPPAVGIFMAIVMGAVVGASGGSAEGVIVLGLLMDLVLVGILIAMVARPRRPEGARGAPAGTNRVEEVRYQESPQPRLPEEVRP